jgi:hypothetical protein
VEIDVAAFEKDEPPPITKPERGNGGVASDPTLSTEPPHLYAASCRLVKKGNRTVLEAWSNTLAIGQMLPTLPLWLSADLVVPLDLEPPYEQACSDLWIA